MKSVWFDKEVLAFVEDLGNQAVKDSCVKITENVRDSMVEGTGLWWPSKRPGGGLHQASIPGVPPAPDTEQLKDSISWTTSSGDSGGAEGEDAKISQPVYGTNVLAIIGHVGTTNEYGIRHEMGWAWYGDKRPFLRPQLKQNTSDILAIFKKYFGK